MSSEDYKASEAYYNYLISEHVRLELKKAALLTGQKDLRSCTCRVEGGEMSQEFAKEYGDVLRQLRYCDQILQKLRGSVLPTPRDRRVLRPGLRAHLRRVGGGGRPRRGTAVQLVDVGVHTELCTDRDVPIIGASCRQIRPFVGQPKWFCAEVPDLKGDVHRMKLVFIERIRAS